MRILTRGSLQRLLKLTVVLGSLWMVLRLGFPEKGWAPTYILRYSWLEYTDADGSPEKIRLNVTHWTFNRHLLGRIPFGVDSILFIYSQFKLSRKYLPFPLSKEEEDFPLAYSMVVHNKVQNFERLLRAIYAPQNIYCVHVDNKSEASVFFAIQAITSCFENVFMVSQAVNVVYAAWPRVQADLNCMADLYNASTKWKYFINLCGQDFPLKTNLEIVRKLRSLKGANSLESETMAGEKKWRVSNVHQIVDGEIKVGIGKAKEPPPFNLPILSGNAYIVVNRGYIRSVLEDNRVLALIEWAKDTYSPDEFLWATIQRIPGVPGSSTILPSGE
uniref:Beta-1,3-galactosyl-O-glycosyl-glycoprotein beta-1,6-N-acetylglucosaminyltransferase n=1 Tax=Dicentrarchus labrax TaxID=13489 RepID=A0A8C4EKF8_DICLA